MRLLIVDDEDVEREAMKKIVEDHIRNVRHIGLAESGYAALELANKERPDVILMDIKMPEMDGLETIEKIQAFHPECKFIIVSAYDMFDYARKAIRLGVKDYLLKPSSAAEIVRIVSGVMQEIEEEQRRTRQFQQQNERFEKLFPILEADIVAQLLFEQVHDIHTHEMMNVFGLSELDRAFVMVLFATPQESLQDEKREKQKMVRTVKTIFRQTAKGWIGPLCGRQLPFIVFDDQRERSYRSYALQIIRRVLNVNPRFPTFDFFIGVGRPYSSLDRIYHSYHEALSAAQDLRLSCGYRLYDDHLSEDATGESIACPADEILEDVKAGDWQRVSRKLTDIVDNGEKVRLNIAEVQQVVLETLLLISRLLEDTGISIPKPLFPTPFTSYRALRVHLQWLLETLASQYEKRMKQRQNDVVYRMKRFIETNLDQEISLEVLAEKLGSSPYTISKQFKDEMGISYIDYLTKCRIDRAKAYIYETGKSIKEIAYDVGYKDPNYFSRVFKKVCGMTPKQYKKKVGKK